MVDIELNIDTNQFVEFVKEDYPLSKNIVFNLNSKSYNALYFKKLNFDYFEILPHGLYIEEIELNEIEELLILISEKKHSFIKLNLNPFKNYYNEDLLKLSNKYKFEILKYNCHLLKTDKDLSEIFNNFNDTRKKHIKRYEKAGIVKVFATNEKEYFDKYYYLYEDSMKRWGVSNSGYSKELILNLHKVNGIKMWVAEVNGEMISGMICLYYKNGVFDWLAATIINDEYKKLYPAIAVQYEVIKDACKRGLKYVNMGASDNLNGVSDFKDSWGAELYETISFSKTSFMFKNYRKISNFIKKTK